MDSTALKIRWVFNVLQSLVLFLSIKHDLKWAKLSPLLSLARTCINCLDLEEQRNLVSSYDCISYMFHNTMGVMTIALFACIIFQRFLCCLAISLVAGFFINFNLQQFAASVDEEEFTMQQFKFRGVFNFAFMLMATKFVIDYYGSMRNNLLLKFTYKILNMKTEYQKVLGNLDECIIWRKEGSIKYYNIQSLNLLKEVLVKSDATSPLLTKIKTFFTQ